MTIKHLVIPGGGPKGFLSIGALQELNNYEVWNIKDVESIYATSAGAYLAVLLALKFSMDDIRDYMVKRPWHECYGITAEYILNAFQKKGMYDIEFINIYMRPFFNTRDISMNITMKEMYELTNIELHFFTIEVSTFDVIDVNYKTFPDLPVCKGVFMSSSIPMMFAPVLHEGKCYVDGGIITNYPLKYCVANVENTDEILGIHFNFNNYENGEEVTDDQNILEFMVYFVSKMIDHTGKNGEYNGILKNEVMFDNVKSLNMESVNKTIYDQTCREEMVTIGIAAARNFMRKHDIEFDDEDRNDDKQCKQDEQCDKLDKNTVEVNVEEESMSEV